MKIAVLIFGFFLAPCRAMVVSPADVQAQLLSAILVAEVEIKRIQPQADATYYSITWVTAELEKIISIIDDHGWFPQEGQEFSIRALGGELQGVGVMVPGYPRPRVGARYKAYLKRHLNQAFEIVGFESGLVPLTVTRQFSRNRTDGSNGGGDGPFLYWDDSFFPIPYFVSATTFDLFPEFPKAIDASFKTWRDLAEIKVEFLGLGCSTNLRNENDGVNNVILFTENWPFDTAAVAITRNFYIAGNAAKAGMILDSDILLNAVNHSFSTTLEPGTHDIQNIVTHEIGHFLGLGHEVDPVDPDAVMFAVASPNETKKRNLTSNDVAAIKAGYLGVGNKLTNSTFSCEIRDKAFGCAAVHGRVGKKWNAISASLYLCFLLMVGRRLTRCSWT